MPEYYREDFPQEWNFQVAKQYILYGQDEKHRPLWGRNTKLEFDANENPRIVYKDTWVITYLPDGFMLNTDGRLLKMYMNKMNYFIPKPYLVQKAHRSSTWEVINQDTLVRETYSDKMLIKPGGNPEFDHEKGELALASTVQWKAMSDKYISQYIALLEGGNIVNDDQHEPKIYENGDHVRTLVLMNSIYPAALLIAAMEFDNPDPFYFRAMNEMINLPKVSWSLSTSAVNTAIPCFRRCMHRFIRMKLGLAV